jgi:hypothetical protein
LAKGGFGTILRQLGKMDLLRDGIPKITNGKEKNVIKTKQIIQLL